MRNADNGESHRARPLVLIVDTNAATVESMAATVRTRDYAVLTALTFEEARAIWRSQQPEVLVVDIRLGQYNGLQLLIRARSDRPDVAAVVTSPVPDPVLEAEAVHCGAAYLIKPVTRQQLLDAIQSALPQPVQGWLSLPDRRRVERRRTVSNDFVPERRGGDRRRGERDGLSWPETLYDRRVVPDRRQVIVPGFQPERRLGPRRGS